MGGTDSPDNLVLLPLKAHYIAHYILHKAYPDNSKLLHAFAAMARASSLHERLFTSRQYEKMKEARSKALKNKPRPEWVKQKLRKPKSKIDNYRQPKSDTHRENIAAALRGKKKSLQHISKMVESQRSHHKARTASFMARKQTIKRMFQESGLTRKQFAEREGININTLKRYLRP
jgi:DNA-binding CsgD family transcriptional regulator